MERVLMAIGGVDQWWSDLYICPTFAGIDLYGPVWIITDSASICLQASMADELKTSWEQFQLRECNDTFPKKKVFCGLL